MVCLHIGIPYLSQAATCKPDLHSHSVHYTVVSFPPLPYQSYSASRREGRRARNKAIADWHDRALRDRHPDLGVAEASNKQAQRLEALQAGDFDKYKRMLEQQRDKESVLVEGYRQIQVLATEGGGALW